MKKIIRGILLGLLAVVVIAASAGAYYLFGQKVPVDEGKVTVLDAKGNTYLAVIDEKSGETMVAVTDEKGNVYAAVTDAAGNVGSTAANLNGVVDKNDLPTNYTGPSIDVSVNGSDYTGNFDSTSAATSQANAGTTKGSTAGTTKGSEQSTTKKNDQTTTKKSGEGELTAYRIQKYQKIFAGGTFLMEFTTNDEDFGDVPITMAIKNNNIYIKTKIQSMDCKMLYKSGTGKNGTTYLIIDDFKKYCKMPEDLMSGLSARAMFPMTEQRQNIILTTTPLFAATTLQRTERSPQHSFPASHQTFPTSFLKFRRITDISIFRSSADLRGNKTE